MIPSIEAQATRMEDAERENLRRTPWRWNVTPHTVMLGNRYTGLGTENEPFCLVWIDNDHENPLNMMRGRKWLVTVLAAMSTMTVSMGSSMLSAAVTSIKEEFPAAPDWKYIMVTSIYVAGFIVGPLLWAPCSEVFGRRAMFLTTFLPFTIFNAACAGCRSLNALLVLRFMSGLFGSSSMSNAGGTIADIFAPRERGLAMGLFAVAPFLGPAMGPVVGGFLSQSSGWRWVAAVIAFLSVSELAAGALLLPETYAPVLLRQRAARLSKLSGKLYKTKQDIDRPLHLLGLFTNQLKTPWILLFTEPIVTLSAVYLAVIYAILYMQFTSFPLIFEGARGWSPQISGLTFIGISVGALVALVYIVWLGNPAYARKLQAVGGYLPPEQRLPGVIVGAFLLPTGLLIFAWTCYPTTIPWIVPLLATVPYGAGVVLLFLGMSNYLVDTYLSYAASVLAAATAVRSCFGVVLPLFTVDIYTTLGLRWAGTLVAVLALVFAPTPIAFFILGAKIRRLSPMSRKADDIGHILARRARENAVTTAHTVVVGQSVVLRSPEEPNTSKDLDVDLNRDDVKDE